MIHVTCERVTPIAAIEAGDTTPNSKKIAAKRIFKNYGLIVAGTAAAALAVIHFTADADTDETTEED